MDHATTLAKTSAPNSNSSQTKDYMKMEYLSLNDGLMESRITIFTTANHANSKLNPTRMNLPSRNNLEDASKYARINNMAPPTEM